MRGIMSLHTIRTSIGEDVPVMVSFYYQPYEKQTHNYPGCVAEVFIESVFLERRDFLDILSDETIKSLEIECHETLEEL